MKKKIVLLTLFSVFLLSAMTVPSLSQWTVGLNVGDWFLYESTLVEYEGEPFPPNEYMTFLQTYNESDWQKLTVTDVSGLVITFESVTHWKNGSETTTTVEEDITTSSALWAIGANLTVGEEVRPEDTFWGWPARIINETMDTEYDGLIRETNYVPWSFLGGPDSDWPFNYEYYFDKETGILVKYVAAAELYQETGDVTFLAVNELVDLSVWVIPEYPTGTVMLLVFVAITVSIALYRRKKTKTLIS